jgi:hypothetical protein
MTLLEALKEARLIRSVIVSGSRFVGVAYD